MPLRSLALVFALLVAAPLARAFPGVCVGKDATPRAIHTTEIVVLRHAGTSIVTVVADYEGPLEPFAFLLPIPSDVEMRELRTVKRAIVGRVEKVSAPRFHAFYEQDPCGDPEVKQDWDEHVRPGGRGFLTPPYLPPPERRYAVSNLISAPIEPSFKGAENEFRYEKLELTDTAELASWIAGRGYHISDAALAALAPHLGPGRRLLFAEVSLDHAEIVGPNRVQLGGVRYVTEQPLGALPITLGLQNARGRQDLVVYVLDRDARYEVTNYSNVIAPTNVGVGAEAAAHVGRVYAALFDSVVARRRQAFVTEYAWSTSGCGQPCPDAPLGLDELLTLGGDALEARARQQPRAGARPERDPAQRELARRQALKARHTYVLSRLRYRYDAASLPRDIRLGPAPALRAGIGIPEGRAGELPRAPQPAGENEIQTRLVALHPWTAVVKCAAPIRSRWGKRWVSEARTARAVPVALGVAHTSSDRALLEKMLTTRLPELGVGPAPAADVPSASEAAPPKPERSGICSWHGASQSSGLAWSLALGTSGALVTRRRRPRPRNDRAEG